LYILSVTHLICFADHDRDYFLQVLIVVFIATLIRSAFGFGEGLVAVPLLALWIPLEIAAPLDVSDGILDPLAA
jgi:uncharacterized membrane protein YfcA